MYMNMSTIWIVYSYFPTAGNQREKRVLFDRLVCSSWFFFFFLTCKLSFFLANQRVGYERDCDHISFYVGFSYILINKLITSSKEWIRNEMAVLCPLSSKILIHCSTSVVLLWTPSPIRNGWLWGKWFSDVRMYSVALYTTCAFIAQFVMHYLLR